jgi:hypothetical protein
MNAQKIFNRIINWGGLTEEVADFIKILHVQKTPMIWVTPPLGIVFDLAEVLAQENFMSFKFSNFMQRDSGIFSENSADIQVFSICPDIKDFLIGAISSLYPENERSEKYTSIFNKFKYIIVFDAGSRLSKLIEVTCNNNGNIFYKSIFQRSDRLEACGVFPSNQDHWLRQWKNADSESETSKIQNIDKSLMSISLESIFNHFIPNDILKIFDDNKTQEIMLLESGEVYAQKLEAELENKGTIKKGDFNDLLTALLQLAGKGKTNPAIISFSSENALTVTACNSLNNQTWILLTKKTHNSSKAEKT